MNPHSTNACHSEKASREATLAAERPSGVIRAKLLFVVNIAEFFLSHRLTLALRAREAGYEVAVACPDSSQAREFARHGIRHIPIPLSRWGGNPIAELRSILALALLYRREKPALVHHVTIKPVLYGSLAARMASVPAVVNAVTGMGLVFSATGLRAWLRRSIVLLLYRVALSHPRSVLLTQNRDDRATFISLHLISPDAVELVSGAGVDERSFTRSPEPPGRIVVVLPGRLLRSKGIVEFVEAARSLRHRTDARFVIAGARVPGAPDEIPQQLLEEWTREGCVELWGECSDMAAVFKNAHIVCLPSYREGMPRALVEAAFIGRPLVATDVNGCRDIVQDRRNGFLVPPRTSTPLAQALLTLIENPSLRAEYGEASYQSVQGRFTLEAVLRHQLEIYRGLLEDG